MTARSMRARLDRLGTPPAPPGAVCRFHGRHCHLGANWPLPYPEDPFDWIKGQVREVHRNAGREVGPDPRELWAVQRHERVPQVKLDREQREVQQLIADAEAVNEELVRQIRAGESWADVHTVRAQLRDRRVFEEIVESMEEGTV